MPTSGPPLALLPESVAPKWQRQRQATPACNGFLHLHLGFDASGLEDLPIHTVWVDDWERGIDAERNAVVLSIPSVVGSHHGAGRSPCAACLHPSQRTVGDLG